MSEEPFFNEEWRIKATTDLTREAQEYQQRNINKYYSFSHLVRCAVIKLIRNEAKK